MPRVRQRVRGGLWSPGGVAGYPLDDLFREVAYIAYHFHWPLDQVMAMEHAERHRWVKEIANINQTLSERLRRR